MAFCDFLGSSLFFFLQLPSLGGTTAFGTHKVMISWAPIIIPSKTSLIHKLQVIREGKLDV